VIWSRIGVSFSDQIDSYLEPDGRSGITSPSVATAHRGVESRNRWRDGGTEQRRRSIEARGHQATVDLSRYNAVKWTRATISTVQHLIVAFLNLKMGFLIICDGYGGHLSVCQFYRDNYKFSLENSNQLMILPFSLTWHDTSARQHGNWHLWLSPSAQINSANNCPSALPFVSTGYI
jgi:hypothetical protein